MPHYKRGVANCKSVKVYFYKFYGPYAASILKFQKTNLFMVGHKLTEIMAKIWAAMKKVTTPEATCVSSGGLLIYRDALHLKIQIMMDWILEELRSF